MTDTEAFWAAWGGGAPRSRPPRLLESRREMRTRRRPTHARARRPPRTVEGRRNGRGATESPGPNVTARRGRAETLPPRKRGEKPAKAPRAQGGKRGGQRQPSRWPQGTDLPASQPWFSGEMITWMTASETDSPGTLQTPRGQQENSTLITHQTS